MKSQRPSLKLDREGAIKCISFYVETASSELAVLCSKADSTYIKHARGSEPSEIWQDELHDEHLFGTGQVEDWISDERIIDSVKDELRFIQESMIKMKASYFRLISYGKYDTPTFSSPFKTNVASAR